MATLAIKCLNIKYNLGREWLTGKSYGAMYLNGEYFFFPVWKPSVWNSFCLSAKRDIYRVFLNDRLLYQKSNYSGDHKGSKENLVVLNGYGKMRKICKEVNLKFSPQNKIL